MGNFFINLINSIIAGLGFVLNSLFSVLPKSPFYIIDNSPIKEYLGHFNYFFPIAEIINILQIWLVAVGSYYIYQIVLRWIKVVE